MQKQRVVLKSNANNIVTLSYEDFDWKKFLAELERLGLDVTNEQTIYCG